MRPASRLTFFLPFGTRLSRRVERSRYDDGLDGAGCGEDELHVPPFSSVRLQAPDICAPCKEKSPAIADGAHWFQTVFSMAPLVRALALELELPEPWLGLQAVQSSLSASKSASTKLELELALPSARSRSVAGPWASSIVSCELSILAGDEREKPCHR